MENILTTTLKMLKVKHTKDFTSNFFENHPYKKHLRGLSQILLEYNVTNSVIRVQEKESIYKLKVPFIAQIKDNFIIVSGLKNDKVSYKYQGKKITEDVDKFNNEWNGEALILSPNKKSVEPNYKINKLEYLLDKGSKIIFLTMILIALIFGFVQNQIDNLLFIILFIPNIIGIYISGLLLTKQMHISNNQANKICNFFKNSSCDNVLESPAAKLMGVIGWSEVGLSYFLSNLIILFFFPSLLFYSALINICGLPYTFWSIWYQKFKVRQWCPMCLIIQALLWVIFILNLVFYRPFLLHISIMDIISTGWIFVLPFILIHFLVKLITTKQNLEQQTNEDKKLRLRGDVFGVILRNQPNYIIEKGVSSIIWGNQEAPVTITVISNPHCYHCATMHEKISLLLKQFENKICVQYIFSPIIKDFDISCKFLIASYLYNKRQDTDRIYNAWYETGRFDRDEFFNKYNLNIEDPSVNEEYEKHKEWLHKSKIMLTPTILVNGYLWPDEYKIEDLKYFLD
ncbi:MAG: thioredoxin domain-containing protein [Prevotella sp.]|jgi:protein-disulfide isomerase/uncharacterized membrane protein|nr:thioredoxin domain-containing protein [Prevotella sp.]